MNRINLYSHHSLQRQPTRRLIKNAHRQQSQHDPWLVLSMAAFNSNGRLMPVHGPLGVDTMPDDQDQTERLV